MTNSWQAESNDAYSELEFGTPVYKACSHCQSAIEIIPLLAGNPLGGKLWSDGFLEAKQMPEPDLLGRCRQCNEIVSLVDLELYHPQAEFAGTGDYSYLPLTLADYELLLQHLDDIAEYYPPYLRLKFWQRSNDKRRYSDQIIPLTEQEKQNMQSLLLLLDDEDANRLIKAEIYRQLGEFERAERVLSDPFDHRVSQVVMHLKQLVREKNKSLVLVFSSKAEGNSTNCCNTTSSQNNETS